MRWVILAFSAMAISFSLFAQIPKTISFQGYLTDADEKPVNGSRDFQFRLYLETKPGNDTTAVWYELHPGVVLKRGVFNVLLGSKPGPLNGFAGVTFDKKYFLEVRVKNGTSYDKMSDRIELTSSAYSLGNLDASNITGQIGNSQLAPTSVTTDKIANNAITNAKISDGVVTEAKIASDAITDAKVSATAAISGSKVIPNFGSQNILTTGNLSVGEINSTNLASINSVPYAWPGSQGAASTVLTNNGSGVLSWAPGLTSVLNSGNVFVGNGSNIATSVSLSGDASINNTGIVTIANNAVTNAKIASNAITNAKMADDAINTNEIVDNAVTNAKLASGIDAAKLTGSISSTTVLGTGSSNQLAFWNASSNSLTTNANLFWNNSSSRLGIGTNTPANKVDVEGSMAIGVSYSGSTAAPTNGAIVEGSVGIGINSPSAKLHVTATSSEVLRVESNNDPLIKFFEGATDRGFIQAFNGDMYFGASAASSVILTSNGSAGLTMNSSRNFGLGMSPNSNRLAVSGSASKDVAGDWLANSDRRIKTDITEIEGSLDVIKRLHPVKFKYTSEWKERCPSLKDQFYYNFIAQEFREVFPEAVSGSGQYLKGDPNEILQVDTYNAQVVAIQAIQDLIYKVEALEIENQQLRGAIEQIRKEIASIRDSGGEVKSASIRTGQK